MPDVVQFVDSVSASPTVRLDLNDDNVWGLKYDGTDFSPPELRRSMAQTLLADGALVTAAAYDNRVIRLRLELRDTSVDAVATRIQALSRELDRPTNILKWQPGTSAPLFFLTMRSPVNRVVEVPGPGTLKLVEVDVLAQPHAVGLRETLPPVTVYNDPAEGTPLNANSNFDANIAPWTASGGSLAWMTAQFHQASGSLLLTPDGVSGAVQARAELVPAVAGRDYRLTAWVRCAVARSVRLTVDWTDSAGGLISSMSADTTVAANTWTLADATMTAPVGAVQARMIVQMGSTPPTSHLLYIDEARIRQAGGPGGCCFEISGIKGDVETPLFMQLGTDFMGAAGDRYPVIGVRRRGTPSLAPFLLQAESMVTGTATALAAANDPAMSGTGPNFARVTPLNTDMDQRLYMDPFPATPGVDVRGRYRVHVRLRQSVLADLWNVRLTYGPLGTLQVDLPAVTVTQAFGPRYVDIGTIQYPYGADPVTDGYSGSETPSQGIRVAIFAQRVSGTGTLDFDCVLFVPADDAYSTVQMPPDSGGIGVIDGARTMVYSVGGSGEIRALPYVPRITSGFPLVSPGRTNRVTFLADGGNVGDAALTSTSTITPYYWPKYLYARPPSS